MSLNDKDLDESIAADWAAIQDKYAGEEPEAVAPEVEAPALSPGAEADTSTRARDESGKFAKAEDKPNGSSKPAKADSGKAGAIAAAKPDAANALPGETGSTDPNAVDPTAAAVARDINRAPSTWKPAARVDFEKLPAGARAEIHRREADYMNGQAQLLPDAKFGKSVSEIVAPYRLLIEAEGGTPERAISDLLRSAAALRMGSAQQKVQTLAQIGRLYGVDMRAFANPNAQQQQPQTLQDPRVDQLLAQLNQERNQSAQREQQSLEGTVTSWMGENDAQGQPLRPYLGDVMTDMSVLVPQIRAQSPSLSHDQVLQQAYERATWGNPEIRTLLLQQQAQGASQTRSAENQNRVREAKRAASVNVPRRASLPTPGKPGTLEDTIANTARELGLIT